MRNEGAQTMRNSKYLWVTASRAKPGKEAEYNKWYDQQVTLWTGWWEPMKTLER
jgi:hypothetical protein